MRQQRCPRDSAPAPQSALTHHTEEIMKKPLCTAPLAVLLATLALLCVAQPAWAADSAQVDLQRLDGKLARGQLRLEYSVDRRSWRELESRGVKPTLVLHRLSKRRDRFTGQPRFHFVYSQKLHARKGAFTFPRSLDLEDGDHLRVELVGYDKDWRIMGLRHGKHRGQSLDLHLRGDEMYVGVAPPPSATLQPPPTVQPPVQQAPDQDWRVAVIAACKEVVPYDSQVDDCTKLAFGKLDARWAAATVRACKHGVEYASQWSDCLELAGTFGRDPSATILACQLNVQYASQWRDCLKVTAQHPAAVNTPALLAACKDSVKYDSQRMSCFGLGKGLGADGPALVKACKGSQDLDKCVESATSAGR